MSIRYEYNPYSPDLREIRSKHVLIHDSFLSIGVHINVEDTQQLCSWLIQAGAERLVARY